MSDARQRIFLVQDEPKGCNDTASRLGRLGYEVCGSARRGTDAIEAIVGRRPDLVLMEIHLAGEIDGIETTVWLRDRIDLPVVLTTTESDDALVRRALAAEPLGYLVRPFEDRELHATLQMALAKHRLERVLRIAKEEAESIARRRTAELAASEARFAAFARIAADWLWETDAQDRFTFLSMGLEKHGFDPSKRYGLRRRAVAAQDAENLARISALEQVIARREPFHDFLYRGQYGDEAAQWCLISGEPIYAEDGTFVGYRGVGRNVQDEVETQRALAEKTRILNAAFAATPDAISVTSADWRGLAWNDRLFELFNLDKAAALAHGDPVAFGLIELARRGEYGPGDPEQVVRERRKRIKAILVAEGGVQYERQMQDGRWLEARLTAIEGGGWVAFYRDISERKRAEIALHELNASLEQRVEERTRALADSERFSRAILDSVGAHVAVLAADGRIVATNAAWRDFAAANNSAGQSSCEGANYLDVCERAVGQGAEDAHTVAAAIRDVIAGRRDSFQLEYPCHRHEERQWFLLRAVRLTTSGEPQAVVSHHDVTAAHLAWERAAAEERAFASLAEVSPVGIFRTGPDGAIIEVNQRWCEITGLAGDRAYGMGWMDALHPGDRQRVADEWTAFARSGGRFRGEWRFLHAGGAVRWAVGEAMRIGGERDVGGYIGTITDITEQKQIELALRALSTDLASLDGAAYFEAAARRLAALLDAPMAYITRRDPTRPDELYTVAAIEDGKTLANFSYSIEGTPCVEVVAGRSVVIGSGIQERYRGDPFLIEKGVEAYAGVPVLDQAGRVIGTVDVLSRKPFREAAAVETTLKIFGVAIGAALARERNRRQYEDLFEFAPQALIMTEQEGRVALANRQAERLFGWTSQEMIGMPIEALLPGKMREHHARLRQNLEGGQAIRMSGDLAELRGLRKDGSVFPVEIDLAPVHTESGVLIATAIEDITPRLAIETALSTSRNNLADALESIDRGVVLYDKDDRVVIFNTHFREHFPGPADAIRVGSTFEEIFRNAVDRGNILVPEGMTKEAYLAERIARHRKADGQPMTRRLADGRIIQVTEHAARNGGIIGIGADITEQLRIEEQLRAVQRMEAIGQLTGGMAHDFNNYLGVIVGNLDMLKEAQSGDPAASRHVDIALQGALRAAELTQSLLAFSRRKRLDPQLIDLNARIESIAKLLGRTLGGGISVDVTLAPDLWRVEVDAAQLDSCIVNVATNARDAMPRGGVLKIATRNQLLDADYARLNAGVLPGAYALIEISDTGTGMSAATLERAFEPFFTTKGAGHGTGLGLSMVYGFIKQSGGHIKIYSEPNHGTTVRICLPRSTTAAVVEYAAPTTAVVSGGGSETVLVVEDNEQLRATAAAQLASLGYRVLQAQDGHAALEILAQRRHIDLLFSDVVMPGGLDGYSLAKLAMERRPDIKVLLTSGFPGETLTKIVADPNGFRLIGKPYRKEELARALRSALAS